MELCRLCAYNVTCALNDETHTHKQAHVMLGSAVQPGHVHACMYMKLTLPVFHDHEPLIRNAELVGKQPAAGAEQATTVLHVMS